MRLKMDYEIMEVEGQRFAVPLSEQEGCFSGMVKLSRTAAEIFALLKEETTEDALVEALSKRYQTSRATLAADVHRMLAALRCRNLLE